MQILAPLPNLPRDNSPYSLRSYPPQVANEVQMSTIMRVTYRPLSDQERAQLAHFKSAAEDLWDLIDAMPAGRETSLAKTKLEEAVMWATKSLTA